MAFAISIIVNHKGVPHLRGCHEDDPLAEEFICVVSMLDAKFEIAGLFLYIAFELSHQ